MPEGDTIYRSARALDRALGGRELTRFEARRLSYRPFPTATRVLGAEARGKHCLVHFDDGRALRTHLRMSGSWHLYRPGERWRRQPAAARAMIEVAPGAGDDRGWVAVCFAAPVVELVASAGHSGTGHLGPDLCRPEPDLDEAVRRLGAYSAAEREIGDALLDQRIACGVGNVYKSEVCFACGLHPFTAVDQIDVDLRRRLLACAATMLRANLDRPDRTTHPDGGLAVYGRARRPCRRCATPIAWAMQGDANRGTYWCPTCQPAGGRRPGCTTP
jgi:endonuclease-8